MNKQMRLNEAQEKKNKQMVIFFNTGEIVKKDYVLGVYEDIEGDNLEVYVNPKKWGDNHLISYILSNVESWQYF